MNPPHAAARLARLKKVDIRKLLHIVAMQKHNMKMKTMTGFDFSRTFPNYMDILKIVNC